MKSYRGKSRLILPDGTIYVGRIIAGEWQLQGNKRILLTFEKEFTHERDDTRNG